MSRTKTTAPAGRREASKSDKERRIKAAAQREFREHGYVEATMRSIAARAGVATGTLFLYAPDKRSLLLWILNEDLDTLTDASFAELAPDDDLLDQLTAVFAPRYRYWGADPELAIHALQEVMLMRADDAPPESQIGHYHQRRASLISRIAALVAHQQLLGRVRGDVPAATVAQLVMTIYLAAIRLWLRERAPQVETGLSGLVTLLRLALNGVTAK